MTFEEKIREIRGYVRKMELLDHTRAVLHWDLEVNTPPGGVKPRSEALGYLAGETHKLTTSPVVGEYIAWLEEQQLEDPVHKAMLRELKRSYDRMTKIPAERYMAFARLTSEAQSVWAEARKRNDYEMFKPYLQQILEFQKEFVGYLGFKANKYDTLLDLYEPGLTTETLEHVFGELRDKLVILLRELQEKGTRPDNSFLNGKYAEDAQRALNERALRLIGFDFQKGRMDVSAHPFTTSFANGDVRLTTRYAEDDFLSSLFSTLHEGGHALYEQGIADDLVGTGLANGVSMGIHESQSRFYENFIGRSREFWLNFHKDVAAAFPQLATVTPEQFYRAVNIAQPSLIRVEADELTYSMHIIIRFEMEKALINDELTVDDAPAVWSEKYASYLGVAPSNYAEGILQDVHWSGGMVGYFPSYALGNLYAAQIYNTMLKDLNVPTLVASGDLSPIREWLREKIHRHGAVYTPSELVVMVTGEPLNASYFVEYLKNKLFEVYRIN
ncbi:carboxypeptidase M32 [Coprothermobacteraceae bacterium]|nr:carboxypeptidase M32 [Coprothermobacteraceae bacterium]